jgi:hypothetical protein
MSQWEDFGFFLEAVKLHPSYNSVLSQQHAASVPTEIQTTKRMCMLIKALATSTNGCRKVASFVAAGGRKRADVIDCLVNCIAECGDLQGGHGDLGFLCGKIIADLETVFLDILPPLTVESLILGYGAGNGVDCLNVPGMEDDTRENRALYLFEWLKAHLKKEENISLALACGWEVTDGQLRSIWSGRLFSLVDTEHILCKIWLAVLHSHACRNVSENKSPFASHCYPLPERGEWEDGLQESMQRILGAFLATKNAGRETGKNLFPISLMFEKESIIALDERAEMREMKIVHELMSFV